MKKLTKLVKDELKVIIELEHEELTEFKKLTKETLDEIEKLREEMSVEERIQLNLRFIHYKIRGIHSHIMNVIRLSEQLTDDDDIIALEINHKVKSILKEIFELDKDFLPALKENIEYLARGEAEILAKKLQKEFSTYEGIVHKLKDTFKLTNYSIHEIEELSNTHIHKLKTNIKKQ